MLNENIGLEEIEPFAAEFTELIKYGIHEDVACKLIEIYKNRKLAHSDLCKMVLDALKEFSRNSSLNVLAQYAEYNLNQVTNKSSFLRSLIRTHGIRIGMYKAEDQISTIELPDEIKIQTILDRTGYCLSVTSGQRKYGGPPPGWEGPCPSNTEIFCGKLPNDIYEDKLIPLFEKYGKIWDLRLMMNPVTGGNKGFAFITYTESEAAHKAIKYLNEYEIIPGRNVAVSMSIPKSRLYIGNIPKCKKKHEILSEFARITPGVIDVIVYSPADDNIYNKGFCFIEYDSHEAASAAKRRLVSKRIKIWGCDILVDWADPEEEPDIRIMDTVKSLYVRNLTKDATEEVLINCFKEYGRVIKVRKVKDYAFINFEKRSDALSALKSLHGYVLCGSPLEVKLAKPPCDKKRKMEILRAREKRRQMTHGHKASNTHSQLGKSRVRVLPNMTELRANMRRPIRRRPYNYGHNPCNYQRYGYNTYNNFNNGNRSYSSNQGNSTSTSSSAEAYRHNRHRSGSDDNQQPSAEQRVVTPPAGCPGAMPCDMPGVPGSSVPLMNVVNPPVPVHPVGYTISPAQFQPPVFSENHHWYSTAYPIWYGVTRP